MPQGLAKKVNIALDKGLFTEATELTFPPDATTDELNCTLERNGSRRRRLGIEYEAGFTLSPDVIPEGQLIRTHSWYNVGGEAGLTFLVVQAGSKLYFYDKSVTPLSAGIKSFTINLEDYAVAGGASAVESPIAVASIKGHLVVVSAAIDAFYVAYTASTNSIAVTKIGFKVRDFEWLSDRAALNKSVTVASVTLNRKYDTANAGWGVLNSELVNTSTNQVYSWQNPLGIDAPLQKYTTDKSNYPALTHPWYSGKDANGNFGSDRWQKLGFGGTSLITNGAFILDLFEKDRAAVSGLTGIPKEIDLSRFTAVAAYAGRVFYSGASSAKNASRIFFSRIIQAINEIGECYSQNDPTAESLSDLLDTDGGYVDIPDARGIRRLHVMGTTLLIFAENGVWAISGVDDVFRATEYIVNKVTEVGIASASSLVSASGRPYWWSHNGIHTISFNQFKNLEETSISETTIQSFFQSISVKGTSQVVGEYDEINSRVLWMYPSSDDSVDYKLNDILIFDEFKGAFYPWRISDKLGSSPYIVGASYLAGENSLEVVYNVVDKDGNTVVDSLGNEVIVVKKGSSFTSSSMKFIVKDTSGKLTTATFSNTDFYDWDTANYESYAHSGYNFSGDISSQKNMPYITVLMRKTEEGWKELLGGGITPIRPSGMLVSAYWDFSSRPSTSPQQAYRIKPLTIPDNSLSSFETEGNVMSTRLRLRGRGKAVKIVFQSEEGKDFNLIGFETLDAKNSTV